MAEPTKQLGPYTLVSKIGVGGFGVVWLAEKRSAIATTQFALKMPRGEDIDLAAFKQEAAIWLQASGHPNVLPLIDADIYDDQVVIVSEYVPDGSLAAWLSQHGGKAPSFEAACEIMDGVLAGLAHLHARQIIHRDLKPANILLQRETPRLADFGLARLLKSSSHSAQVSGTLAYMAPETLDGDRNEQTDVWSVGVIFYELLAGRLPYDQPDIPSLVGAIMRFDPPPLADTVPEVLRQIVMKALQRDPANRYSSAAEMRRDLREAEHQLWLGGRETFIEPENRTQPIPTPPEPFPGSIAPQPTVPIPPAKTDPSILPVKPTLPSETLPLPSPVKQRSRSSLWLSGAAGALLLGILVVVGIYLAKSYASQQASQAGLAKQTTQPANTNQASTSAAETGQAWRYALKQTITGHTQTVESVAFSPDGKTLASGSGDRTIKLWDAQTGALKQTLTEESAGKVYSIVFSPDGMTLASGGSDKTLKLWDTQTGSLQHIWTGHVESILSVAFSPTGKTVASGSFDKTIKIWDVQTGALLQTLTSNHPDGVRAVALSSDGRLASGDFDDTIKLWDPSAGSFRPEARTLPGHNNLVTSVAFSPDGKILASGSFDLTVKLWDVQSGSLKRTLTVTRDLVRTVAISADGTTLASAGDDQKIRIWDLNTGALRQTLEGHSHQVNSVAFSPDGKTLVSGSADKTVMLWRAE
jgi:WD40 repeat protein